MSLLCWVPINDKIGVKILVTLLLLAHLINSENMRPSRAYLKLSIEHKIRYHGYPCDTHEILTPDGYYIRLFRIPYGINPTKNSDCDGEYINMEMGNDYVENDNTTENYMDYEELDDEDEQNGGIDTTSQTPSSTTESCKTSKTIINTRTKATTASSFIKKITQSPTPVISSTTTTTTTASTLPSLVATSATSSTTSANNSSTLELTSTTSISNTIKSSTTKSFTSIPINSIITSTPSTSAPESSTKKTFIQKIPRKKKLKRFGQFRTRETNEMATGNKSVVLFLHGMLGSPANFLHNGKHGAGFYFADRGFDVWLLCLRGNECGQKKLHAKYDKKSDKAFWDFTLNHMSAIDIPTAIDHILPITNQSAVHMIGHSAGTTNQIILLSERPEYASKLKVGSHFGGSVFIGRSDYPLLQFGASLTKVIKGLYNYLGWFIIFPRALADTLTDFVMEICYNDEYFGICEAGGSLVGSHKSVLIDPYITIPTLLYEAQLHLSAKEVFHFMEMMSTGEIMKYDYGKRRNLREYGQGTPPKYNLSRVTNPTIIHYSETDQFGNLADLKRGVSLLPNVIQVYQVPFWRFSHIDYILAKNASKLVYENTCKMFKRYDSGERFEPIKNVDIEEPEVW